MDRDDIIRMAQEAGFKPDMFGIGIWDSAEFNRFAALVAAAEREECARICDAVQRKNEEDGAWLWEAKNCANAIRAKGQV